MCWMRWHHFLYAHVTYMVLFVCVCVCVSAHARTCACAWMHVHVCMCVCAGMCFDALVVLLIQYDI